MPTISGFCWVMPTTLKIKVFGIFSIIKPDSYIKMKFLGIDLGWKSQPSGLCYLELIDGQLEILDLDRKEAIADILTWIDTCVQPEEPALIAVDAPTLIPNASGSRLPDKLSHKYFGKYHA